MIHTPMLEVHLHHSTVPNQDPRRWLDAADLAGTGGLALPVSHARPRISVAHGQHGIDPWAADEIPRRYHVARMSISPLSPSLRVALRVPDGPLPAYLNTAIHAILDVPGVAVVLILIAVEPRRRPSVVRQAIDSLESLYERLECAALRGGPQALRTTAGAIGPSRVTVVRTRGLPEETAAYCAANPDVLVDLRRDTAADDLPIPRLGRWNLYFAVGVDGSRKRQLTRPRVANDLAISLLGVHLGSGLVQEAHVGVSALRRIGFARDRDAVYWRAALLPARRLARLVAGDLDRPCAVDTTGARTLPDCEPGHDGHLPPFLGLAAAVTAKVVERVLYRSTWIVLTRERQPDQGPPRDLEGFAPVAAPRGRFYADPFIADTGDGLRLYVEDSPEGVHQGRISRLSKNARGDWVFERVVLDDLVHRAYPHATAVEGGCLLTVDNGDAGGVDLYLDRGGDSAPERVAQCLAGVRASDPTLLVRDGRHWLFVTVKGHGMNPWDELHLYSATTPTGPWQSHPLNPVVADVRRSRPGGRIFQSGGLLIRPGQDCSVTYGQRIVLNAITVLTPTDYEERPIGTIEPDGMHGVRRTHTYTFSDSTEALDGYLRRLRLFGVPRTRGSASALMRSLQSQAGLPMVGAVALTVTLFWLIGLILVDS